MNSMKTLIRKIILEQVDELFSADSEETQGTTISKDSADDQIDAFIIKFERDSVAPEKDDLSESLANMSLAALIREQDETGGDDEAEEEPEGQPLDEPAPAEPPQDLQSPDDPEPVTSADVEVDEPEALPKMPLDVDEFTKRVARLAMNYDTLLDIKSIIINRAMSFLSENYDEDHVTEMRDILDKQFDFDLSGGSEIPAAPFAVGANPSGAGMGGGGG